MSLKFSDQYDLKVAELWCSILLVTYCEYLALVPYLLRSLRISKMFKARETYVKEERIPREQIQKWNETRMLVILTCIMCVWCAILISSLILGYGTDSTVFIDRFWIMGLFERNGTFKSAEEMVELMNSACLHFMVVQAL